MTMRARLVRTVLAMLIVATASAASAAPKIGEPAPEFSAVDSQGRQVKLGQFRGKTVVLEWTNHGCPFVQNHYGGGHMQALQRELAAAGVVWLTVVSSAPGLQGHVHDLEAEELTRSRKAAPTAVLLDPDGRVGRLFDARTTPHMFVIAADGKLAYKGAIDDRPTTRAGDPPAAFNYVRNALNQLVAGKPVDPAVTRPYGCSVKYAH